MIIADDAYNKARNSGLFYFAVRQRRRGQSSLAIGAKLFYFRFSPAFSAPLPICLS